MKLGTLQGHTSWVLDLSIIPNGQYMASASNDKTVKIWDLETHENIATIQQHTDTVWGVDWNSDGTKLVSSGADNTLIIYNCVF